MGHTKYLLIGGGIAADAAIEGIREVDPTGSIALVTSEPHAPYNRPPLSKALWKGEPVTALDRPTHEGVTLHLGRTITGIDLEKGAAVDDLGASHEFERVLFATGGKPRRLPFGGDDILYFRTRDDYRHLRELTGEGRSFAVIGGGFIGCELAAALALNGQKTHLVVPEQGLGARVFPAELSQALVGYYESKGVTVHVGSHVTSVERRGGGRIVEQSNGVRLEVDGVVAGIGLVPEIELARAAGLAVGDGIEVDAQLRTSHPNAFAAGDVANLPMSWGRLRFEHEDASLSQGKLAGRNMAGAGESYSHLPMFYSDLFELGYEAVGELDARMDTFADWKTPNEEGVVYYLRDNRVRGVLLVNTWDRTEEARALIGSNAAVKADSLRGRLTQG